MLVPQIIFGHFRTTAVPAACRTLDSARWTARAEAFIPRDSCPAADAQLDEGAAFGTEFRLVRQLSRFRGILTRHATASFRQVFQSFGWNRLAADFAQDGRLPVVVLSFHC